MHTGKLHFFVGLLIGIALSSVFFLLVSPRYKIKAAATGEIIKADSWSGESWRLVDGQWKKVTNYDRNWKEIDSDLKKALNLPDKSKKQKEAIEILKSRYPSLKDLTDEEITERIKLVYSKQILTDLYLSNFSALNSSKKE